MRRLPLLALLADRRPALLHWLPSIQYYYQQLSGQPNCTFCASTPDQPQCKFPSSCTAGKYGYGWETGSCASCASGRFSNANAQDCTSCSTLFPAFVQCGECSSGRFVLNKKEAGTARCHGCPAQYYQPAKEQGSCLQCEQGSTNYYRDKCTAKLRPSATMASTSPTPPRRTHHAVMAALRNTTSP